MSLREALGLKDLPRAGWVRAGVPAPESVAAHSWGVGWLALLLCPPGLDREKVLAMALLHDLPEVRAGDVTPHDGVTAEAKHAAEAAAAEALLSPALLALWREAADGSSPEARFVKQLDRLDMGLQALRYAAEGRLSEAHLAEFLASARRDISHPCLLALLEG